MIRAIYRNGVIHPLDAVPPEWHDGDEVAVELIDSTPTPEELDAWVADVKAATANISDEEHDRFMAAIAQVEAESKMRACREVEQMK